MLAGHYQFVPPIMDGRSHDDDAGGSASSNLPILAALSDERIASLPDVPTMKELGLPALGLTVQGRFGAQRGGVEEGQLGDVAGSRSSRFARGTT